MPLNVINPVADYNAAHSTSYVGRLKGVYVESVGEVWQLLSCDLSAGTPVWLKIDEATGVATGVADTPTGAIGALQFSSINGFYDAANDLVIASGYDSYATPSSRQSMVAWNSDGTIAWEQYWATSAGEINAIQSNANVPGVLFCVLALSTPWQLQSVDPATGARTSLCDYDGDAYLFSVDNDGNVWTHGGSGAGSLRKYEDSGGWGYSDKFAFTELGQWVGFDPVHNKIACADRIWPRWDVTIWDVAGDSLDSTFTVDGLIGDNIREAYFETNLGAWASNSWGIGGTPLVFDATTFELLRNVQGASCFEPDSTTTPQITGPVRWTSATRVWTHKWLGDAYTDPGFMIWDDCTSEVSLFVGTENEAIVNRVRLSDLTFRDKIDNGTGAFTDDPSNCGFVGALRIGRYGYFATEVGNDETGLWLFKVDLQTFAQTDALFLANPRDPDSWPYAYQLCSDFTHKNIYIQYSSYNAGGGGGDVVVFKVEVASFSVLDTLDLSATYNTYSANYYTNDLFICDTDYLFLQVAAASGPPYTPTLLRIDLATFTLDTAIDTAGGWSGSAWTTGYQYLNCGVLGSDGYIYCGALDLASSTERAVVLKIDPWTPAIEAALPIRSDVTSSPAFVCSLTTDGTYLYAVDTGFGVPSNDPKIAKIFIYEFTLDASATLTNDNYPAPKEAVMVDGSIYLTGYEAPRAGGSTGVLRAWEVKASDLTVVREVDLALTRNQYVSQRPLLYCFAAAVEAIRRWVNVNINMRRR